MEDISSGPTIKDAILILGSSNHARTQLLEGATGSTLSFSKYEKGQLVCADLKISNKYYDAGLKIYMPSSAPDSDSFSLTVLDSHRNYADILNGRVDAVIALHYESESREDGERYRNYLSSATDALDPGVMLYVMEDESNISPEIIDWCHENGFEAVSLKNEEEVVEEGEESFQEKMGAARVMEALESHMWTNMEFKTELRPQKETKSAKEALEEEADVLEEMPPEIKASFGNLMNFMNLNAFSDSKDENGAGPLAGDDEMGDLMGAMAGPLQLLRSQLSGLDDDKRRAMAAKVAIMMMSSFGDDEEDEDLLDEI